MVCHPLHPYHSSNYGSDSSKSQGNICLSLDLFDSLSEIARRKIPNPERELLSFRHSTKKKGGLPHSKIWFRNLCQIALGTPLVERLVLEPDPPCFERIPRGCSNHCLELVSSIPHVFHGCSFAVSSTHLCIDSRCARPGLLLVASVLWLTPAVGSPLGTS
jgi:hypothetical protein